MTQWGVIPSIRVRDMAAALAFCQEILGITLHRGDDEATNPSLSREDAHLMIDTPADHYGDEYNTKIRDRLGTPSAIALHMEARDLAALYGRLRSVAGTQIVDPLATPPWGQDEITIEDPDGNWLTFWEKPAG